MLRTLPIPVRPVAGETLDSYFRRLAAANLNTPAALWAYMRTDNPALPEARDLNKATDELERLGNLPTGWFADSRHQELLPIRCPHSKWILQICDICSHTPPARAGCPRCSAGEPTQVSRRVGTICLKHRYWSHAGTYADVSHLPHHLAAEREFRRHLPGRGISLSSGELALAHDLLRDWASARTGTPPAQAQLIDTYPEAVRLATTLTNPLFVELLLDPHWSGSQHAYLLSAVLADLIGNPLPDLTIARIWDTVHSGRRAIETAFMLPSRRTSHRRALVSAAYTHRACLLRHLDARVQRPNNPRAQPIKRPPTRDLLRYQQEPAMSWPDAHSSTAALELR